jgi:predicted AlkP superfamily pyrophosphatase or phosphodiesterase
MEAADGAAALGMPAPAENPGMGDLILYAKPGYAFSGAAAGEAVTGPAVNYGGTHGQRADDPELDGIFLASGAGIKPGVKLARIRNLDVAPTIARLLDVPLPGTEGVVLEQILTGAK